MDGLQFPAPDIIYEMVVDPGDAFNIFIDLCPGTNFDASIGIIHKEEITDCANATDESIVGYPDDNIFIEWRDSESLCPVSDYGEVAPGNDGFVPLARDVYIEAGTYYIVVDGDNDGSIGDFTLVIGEMLELEDYQVSNSNDYIDITFSEPVYGVLDADTWLLGWPIDLSAPPDNNLYWSIRNYSENYAPLELGTVVQTNGQSLLGPMVPPYPGYTSLRIPIIGESSGAPITGFGSYFLNIDYDNDSDSKKLVNSSGIPISRVEELIVFNDIGPPEIDSLYNLTADNERFNVIFSEGVYSNNNGSGGVTKDHFIAETFGGEDLGPTITQVTRDDGSLVLGGEDTLRFNVSYSSPASGLEGIHIRAKQDSVFNAAGITMGTQWSSHSFQLNDLIPPEVSYAFSPDSTAFGVDPGVDIKIVFDDSVKFKGGASISSTAVDDVVSLNYEINGILGDAISFDATINTDKDTITVNPDGSLIEMSRVLVKVAGDTIVDANSNIMPERQLSFTVADMVFPEIESSSLAADNEYVSIVFSENLWSETGQSGDLSPSDFSIILDTDNENSNASVATIDFITDGIGTTADLQNIDAVRLYLSFDSNPSGVESITIAPVLGEIFDQGNNSLFNSGISFDLFDQLTPSINIKSISSTDDTGFIHPDTSFVITSTESLQRSDGSAITSANLTDYITLEYYTNSESIDYEVIVNENKTVIEINPATSMNEWKEVSLTIVSQNESISITDEAGNAIEETTSIIRVDDITAPTIDNASIEETNTYITLTFSENLWSETGQSGDLSPS
ncbi:uncharacterized protein METZ01_LOCUS120331, partial [marine metagenome]